VNKLMSSHYFMGYMKDPKDEEFKFKLHENQQFLKYVKKSENKNFITKDVTEQMANERLKMSLDMCKMKLYQTKKIFRLDKFKCKDFDKNAPPC
jgi:hypothetical protein